MKQKNKVRKLPFLLILALITVPMIQAVTIDGPTNFMGPGGGIVRFDNILVSNQMNIVNNIYRFANSRYGGQRIGALGFDCDTGDNMTITGVTLTQLTYTITGAGDQRIYFQGLGAPTIITGGTVVMGDNDVIIVTTTGADTVTLEWEVNSDLRNLINTTTGFLVLVAFMPVVAGVGLFMSGNLDDKALNAVAALTVGVVLTVVIWVMATAGY